MKPLSVLGISGSLRAHSYNTGLLRAAIESTPEGMAIHSFDLSTIPLFNQDFEKMPPESVRLFKEQILTADGILIATPEYNYSVPGVLKNAIDWASRPYAVNAWNGKPLAVMGAGGVAGTVRAQMHLRQVAVNTNMRVMNRPEIAIQRASEKFNAEGALTDEPTRDYLKKFLAAFAEWIRSMNP